MNHKQKIVGKMKENKEKVLIKVLTKLVSTQSQIQCATNKVIFAQGR